MDNRLNRILLTLILSGAICLTLLAGSAAAVNETFFIQYPDSSTQWVEGGNINWAIADSWDSVANDESITYALDTRTGFENNLYSIFGTAPQGMYWWKTYVSEDPNATSWDSSYVYSGYDLTDHYGTEHPYIAFVYGTWQTTPSQVPANYP
jgi:hypothetical protein